MRRHSLSLAFLVVVLGGCGGGGSASGGSSDPGGNTPGPGTGGENTFGPIQTRGFSNSEPVIQKTPYVTTFGMAGTFSSVRYSDLTPTLADTQIVAGANWKIVTWDYGFTSSKNILNAQDYPLNLAYTPDGSRLYYEDEYDGCFRVDANGLSAPVALAAGISHAPRPAADGVNLYSISADRTKIQKSNLAGNTRTDTMTAPSGTTFIDLAAFKGRYGDFLSLTSNNKLYWNGLYPGTTLTDFSEVTHLTATADGETIAVLGKKSDILTIGVLYDAYNGVRSFPAPAETKEIALSPDGQYLLTSSSGVLSHLRIVRVSDGAIVADRTEPDLVAPYIGPVAWSPFVANRSLVGDGGAFGTTCAALIASQASNRIGSLVLADAKTRTTAKVYKDPDQDNSYGDLTYFIEADRLTKLTATATNAWRSTTVGLTATTNGAVVIIDGDDGSTSSVFTYTVARSGSRPKVRREGSNLVIEGDLEGGVDANGKVYGPSHRVAVPLGK